MNPLRWILSTLSFLRFLAAPEDLGVEVQGSQGDAGVVPSHRHTKIGGFLRWVLTPESLPPADAAPAPADTGSQMHAVDFMRWLLAPEPLPAADDAEPGTAAASPAPNWFAALLASEPLPEAEPTPPPPPATGFSLRWLFASEDLDATSEDQDIEGGAPPA